MSKTPKAATTAKASDNTQPEGTIETWIRACKAEHNITVVKITDETELRGDQLFVKVYVKA